VSDHQSDQGPDTAGRRLQRSAAAKPKLTVRKLRASIWRNGALFHVSTRYPRKPKKAKVDRLAGILRQGLIAPGHCQDGTVYSDLNLTVTGTAVPYDSLAFLHRFGSLSYLYTPDDLGRFAVFIDPALPVLTPEEMGEPWVVMCQDEVYVRDRVAPEKLIGVAVHPADADSVIQDLHAELERLCIPLFDIDGNVLWQPASSSERTWGSRGT
jgi:hypothetical protein